MKPGLARFEDALLRGETAGYAVCVKPLRFAAFPEHVVETFAELGETDCYYVFEREADAWRTFDEIAPERRLGGLFQVRRVSYLSELGPGDGPRLDLCGHPFAMRGFIVDGEGAMKEWRHPGRFGWRRRAPNPTAGAEIATASTSADVCR
jgi:hypothetical protein